MGNFQGGLLWVESKEGQALPPCTATGLGPEVFRLSLVFFNSTSLQKLPLDDGHRQEDLQFPCAPMRAHSGERSTATIAYVGRSTSCNVEPTLGSWGGS
eukprot:6997719-Prorocentrum_lima.AAC.1